MIFLGIPLYESNVIGLFTVNNWMNVTNLLCSCAERSSNDWEEPQSEAYSSRTSCWGATRLLTVPLTTAWAEKSLSALKRLKWKMIGDMRFSPLPINCCQSNGESATLHGSNVCTFDCDKVIGSPALNLIARHCPRLPSLHTRHRLLQRQSAAAAGRPATIIGGSRRPSPFRCDIGVIRVQARQSWLSSKWG